MTTDPNHDDILTTLKGIASILRWCSVPILGLLSFVVASIVGDHFSISRISADSAYMKPKVVRLWIETHPEEAAREASSHLP